MESATLSIAQSTTRYVAVPTTIAILTDHIHWRGLIAYLAFRWREAGAALGVVIAVDDAIRQAGLSPNRIARGSTLDPWRAPLANRERWHPRRNILVPIDSVADKSNAPTPKYVIITIKKKCIIERTPMPPGGRSQKKDEKLPHLAHFL